MTKSILIVDDHPIFRRGLYEIIQENSDFHVIAEADSGEKALNILRDTPPAIVILDIGLPVLSGLDILAKINRWSIRPTVVMLTMYNDEIYLHKALEFGALGYVLKDNAETELIDCLHAVTAGKHYISPGVSHALAESSFTVQKNQLEQMTSTERKIFLLIADYKTNNDISELLGVSIRTVQNHRANICSKLGLRGHNALFKLANQYRYPI
ncbi:MAG: response regulator transcription factor [Methylococcaceae bacterium]